MLWPSHPFAASMFERVKAQMGLGELARLVVDFCLGGMDDWCVVVGAAPKWLLWLSCAESINLQPVCCRQNARPDYQAKIGDGRDEYFHYVFTDLPTRTSCFCWYDESHACSTSGHCVKSAPLASVNERLTEPKLWPALVKAGFDGDLPARMIVSRLLMAFAEIAMIKKGFWEPEIAAWGRALVNMQLQADPLDLPPSDSALLLKIPPDHIHPNQHLLRVVLRSIEDLRLQFQIFLRCCSSPNQSTWEQKRIELADSVGRKLIDICNVISINDARKLVWRRRWLLCCALNPMITEYIWAGAHHIRDAPGITPHLCAALGIKNDSTICSSILGVAALYRDPVLATQVDDMVRILSVPEQPFDNGQSYERASQLMYLFNPT